MSRISLMILLHTQRSNRFLLDASAVASYKYAAAAQFRIRPLESRPLQNRRHKSDLTTDPPSIVWLFFRKYGTARRFHLIIF
jgi:hypothetical protein